MNDKITCSCMYCGKKKKVNVEDVGIGKEKLERLRDIPDTRIHDTNIEDYSFKYINPCPECQEKFKGYVLVVETVDKEITGRWVSVPEDYIVKKKRKPVIAMDRMLFEQTQKSVKHCFEEYAQWDKSMREKRKK